MRSVVVGAVESTRVTLEVLAEHGARPAALFTLPLARSHRHSDFVDLRPLAQELGVPVVEAANVNAPEALAALRELDAAYVFVIGWSQICRPAFLASAREGLIGFHPAPLPENRGRGVIPWTILQRRTETGGTLFWMDEGMDTGDVLMQERFAVAPDETAASLYAKHGVALRRMLAQAVPMLQAGTAPRAPQDHTRASYCAKRTPDDGLIDWTGTADAVWTLIRAVGDPYPGAFTYQGERRVAVWAAEYVGGAPHAGLPGQVQVLSDEGALVQCGDGRHVLLTTVQREGEERAAPARVLRLHERLGIDWVALHCRIYGQGSL